jgi:flagellar basal body-associated protein FliL
MNQNLWIAVIVAAVMVLAHVGVFWWFVCRGGKSSSDSTQPESPTDSTKRPDNP